MPNKIEKEGNKRTDFTSRQQESQENLVASSLLCSGNLLILTQIKQYLLLETSALPIVIHSSSGKPTGLTTTTKLFLPPLLSQSILHLK